MTDRAATHAMTDVAALYALGALSQQEARSFEQHLQGGCAECEAELESFANTVAALGFSASDEQPPDRVRSALLARMARHGPSEIEAAVKTTADIVSVRASDGEWHEVQKGVSFKRLYVDTNTGIATTLVRMQPGTALPIHRHLGVEQVFVIEGDCNIAGHGLVAGDYHRADAGTTHETTCTVEGTLFLLIAPECYEVLDAR